MKIKKTIIDEINDINNQLSNRIREIEKVVESTLIVLPHKKKDIRNVFINNTFIFIYHFMNKIKK